MGRALGCGCSQLGCVRAVGDTEAQRGVFLSPCFPAQLPDPPELVPGVNPAGVQIGAAALTQPGHGLSVTSAPTVLRGGWKLPSTPSSQKEGGKEAIPKPGNGGAFCEAFPIGSISGTRSSPGRALWVCSPASQELGWSQRHRARPKVAAGGLQPPRLLGGRAPFIDFAGRQRYF